MLLEAYCWRSFFKRVSELGGDYRRAFRWRWYSLDSLIPDDRDTGWTPWRRIGLSQEPSYYSLGLTFGKPLRRLLGTFSPQTTPWAWCPNPLFYTFAHQYVCYVFQRTRFSWYFDPGDFITGEPWTGLNFFGYRILWESLFNLILMKKRGWRVTAGFRAVIFLKLLNRARCIIYSWKLGGYLFGSLQAGALGIEENSATVRGRLWKLLLGTPFQKVCSKQYEIFEKFGHLGGLM